MADNDPFRGIKLSEQASTPGLEQRLFAARTINAVPEPPETGRQAVVIQQSRHTRDPVTEGRSSPENEPQTSITG